MDQDIFFLGDGLGDKCVGLIESSFDVLVDVVLDDDDLVVDVPGRLDC